MAQLEIDLEGFGEKPVFPEDHGRFPPKKRRNLLLGSGRENLLPGCIAEDQMIKSISRERHAGELGERKAQESLDRKMVKVECSNENPSSNITNGSFSDEIQTANSDTGTNDTFFDELDHLVLKERLKRIPMSKFGEFPAGVLEEKTGTGFGDQRHGLPENRRCKISRSLKSCSSKGTVSSSHKSVQMVENQPKGNSPTYADDVETQASTNINSSEESPFKCESDKGIVRGSNMLNLPSVKVEPSCCDATQNSISTLASELSGNRFMVKTEILDACSKDELDDMFLSIRMKLLQAKNGSKTTVKETSECESKKFSSNMGSQPFASQPAQPLKINRPRKRRKTVTDSVETAMEEDAPGLLQILVEKGVVVSEIKLYSEPESDDVIDDGSSVDNFGDLEAVISQLFTRRESLLGVGKFRISKAEKPSYCLECLFSLVEQARYLQFRKWPVEWGWCRDLQSFIFVFERHKRIVLERPEYGYATYFFEFADSLSIDWQIKRLIIVMKFTSCSRSSLLENKSLVVGDDLSVGEARILMEYGWTPNTGLGTMVNYCDRVVHDRKNEKDRSEWRSKISKLLVDGLNGGTLLNAEIPVKAEQYELACSSQVKLETT